MFFHLYKYRLKNLIKEREVSFWVMAFPLILATLFYFGFGSALNNGDIKFEAIDIAVVTEEENQTFTTVIDSLKDTFFARYTDSTAADNLLEKGDIIGIIYVCETPYIKVKSDGTSQTLLKTFIDEYNKQAYVIKNTIAHDPSKLPSVIEALNTETVYLKDMNLIKTKTNMYTQYFYALIAMSCLFASYIGLQCTFDLQPNISSLGMRRSVSPVHKMFSILSDIAAGLSLQFTSTIILLVYLILILKIDMGTNYPAIVIASFLAGIIGLCMGICIGSIGKMEMNMKVGIATGVSMLFSFLSDLMVNGLKYMIESHFPLLNRINPAALLTDAFYAVNAYGYGTRFFTDLIIMGIIALILITISYFALRRTKYANL